MAFSIGTSLKRNGLIFNPPMRKGAIETKQTIEKLYFSLGLPLKSKLKYVIYLFKTRERTPEHRVF